MLCAAGAAMVLAACGTVQQASVPQPHSSTSLAGLAPQPSFPTVDVAAPAPDVWKRIRRGFAMPDLQTAEVAVWTDYYAARPDLIRRTMERSSPYLYFILEEINRRGLPTELALLPFVESGWDPTALSRSKASGLWQFIPSTGRHFKLRQDEWVDERRDLVASTQAALDYLEYLFNFQGDWYLALASYNWGEGSVMRAMQKNEAAGLRTDYTSLTMPEETRNYVPKLQAIKNIVAEPARYGVALPSVENQPYFVRVARAGDIDVPLAARLAGMSVEEFTALNPAFNRGIISGETGKPILLPVGQVDVFLANLDAYDGPLVTPQTRPAPAAVARVQAQAKAKSANATRTAGSQQAGRTKTAAARTRTHRVRSGDTLYKLAERYRTTVQALQSLNRLDHSRLRVGQLIRVPGAG